MNCSDEVSIGVNLTSYSQLSEISQLINNSNSVQYVELLIDNFISCDPVTIRDALCNIPVAVHIMNSRFLERDWKELEKIAKKWFHFLNV